MPRSKQGYGQAYDRDLEADDDDFDEPEAGMPPMDVRSRGGFGSKKIFLLLGFLALLGIAGGAFFYHTSTAGTPAPEGGDSGSGTSADSYDAAAAASAASSTGTDAYAASEAADAHYDVSHDDDKVNAMADTTASDAYDASGPTDESAGTAASEVVGASKGEVVSSAASDTTTSSSSSTSSTVAAGDGGQDAEASDLKSVAQSVQKLEKASAVDAKLKKDTIQLEAGAETAATEKEADADDNEDDKVIATETKLHDVMKKEEQNINAKLAKAEQEAGNDEAEKEVVETVRSDAAKVEKSIDKADSAQEAAHDLVDSVLASDSISDTKKKALANVAAEVVTDISKKETAAEEQLVKEVKTAADMDATSDEVEDASEETSKKANALAASSEKAEDKLETLTDKVDASSDGDR
jgi:hypothetical protein